MEIYKNAEGKVVKTRKSAYDRANNYKHSKPMRGGPEGRGNEDMPNPKKK